MNIDYDKLDDDTNCSEHSSSSSNTPPNDRVMCPICLERVTLSTSTSSSSTTKPTLQLNNCGHLIHYLCLHKYVTSCVETHVKKRIRQMNTFSLVEFRNILESSCVLCPICRLDIRDSKRNTEVNELCSVIFKNYERCLKEAVTIDIRDEVDNDDDGSHDARTVVDDGTASLITNNATHRHEYAMNARRCQGLFCGCGIVFLFMYSIVHIVLQSPQVQYYGPYNVTT